MKKVSLIVPIFNSQNYIDKCISSIVDQTYKNIEIILINDGSTDNSMEICNKWLKLDERIKIYNNTNHGVSYSRNFGIKKSTGYYVTFVDSDDIVSKYFIENLVTNLEKSKADCSICGIKGFYHENEINWNTPSNIQIFKENSKNKLFTLYGGFLANKMYKRDIIIKNKLQLDPEISISEDLLFNLNYFKYTDTVVYNSKVEYYYRQYSTSSFNRLDNLKWFSVINTYEKILNMISGDLELEKEVLYNFEMILLEAKYRIKYVPNITSQQVMKIENLNQKYLKYSVFKNFNISKKIKIMIFSFFPKLTMKYKRRKMGD